MIPALAVLGLITVASCVIAVLGRDDDDTPAHLVNAVTVLMPVHRREWATAMVAELAPLRRRRALAVRDGRPVCLTPAPCTATRINSSPSPGSPARLPGQAAAERSSP